MQGRIQRDNPAMSPISDLHIYTLRGPPSKSSYGESTQNATCLTSHLNIGAVLMFIMKSKFPNLCDRFVKKLISGITKYASGPLHGVQRLPAPSLIISLAIYGRRKSTPYLFGTNHSPSIRSTKRLVKKFVFGFDTVLTFESSDHSFVFGPRVR